MHLKLSEILVCMLTDCYQRMTFLCTYQECRRLYVYP